MTLDPIALRNAFGSFATGVCVITAHNREGKPFGMTINSFSSVSLEPALLLWNLQDSSDCFDEFAATEKFTVNVLAADQLDLSNSLAKKGEHDLPEGSFTIGENGAPVLNGAITSFECDVWARYPGGDHEIIVGEVKQLTATAGDEPLLFFSGRYRELAEA